MRTTIAVGVALSCATGGDAAILDELLAGAGMTATAFMDTHWQRAPLYASAAEVVANDDAGAEPSWRQDFLPSDQSFPTADKMASVTVGKLGQTIGR